MLARRFRLSSNRYTVCESVKIKVCRYQIMISNVFFFFYGWGSTASRLEPFQGGSLLFTTKFPEIPGSYFIDLGRMKG